MADKKIVILGGRGMLGTDIKLYCQENNVEPLVLDLPDFDITNEEHLREAVGGADAVINCAAYTNVEKAEDEPELAYDINARAVGRLGEITKGMNTWVLHISTDFVFDGSGDRPYVETDKPNPLSVYGSTKFAGEELLVASGCRHCIMRVQWTYGAAGNNFVKKLVSLAEQGRDLKVVDDQIGSPTATAEAARAIWDLLEKKPVGLFHFAAEGYVSRYDMARYVFEKLEMPVKLSPCKSSDFKTKAERPLNSRFDCTKIKGVLNHEIAKWDVALDRYLGQI